MDAVTSFNMFSERYRNYARTAATIFGILLIVLLFWKFFTYPDPPPGQDGTLVSFGEPNVGQGNERSAEAAPPIETAEPEPEPEPVEEVEPEPEPEPEVVEPKVEPKKEEAQPDNKKVLEAEASKERALKEKKRREEKKKRDAEAAKKKQEKAELDKKRKAEAEVKRKADEIKRKAAEAKRKADEEAKRKADAAAKAKADAEALFGGGTGSGQGNTGTPGNQGSPDGDPNSSALDGMGTGRVGGGLSNRGGKGPKLSDRSQKNGKVIVKVCVDSNGKVISASPTQAGSSIWDSALNRKIKANAMKWSFANGELDKQCGTITYTFKLQ